jgi:hypothetical protein
MGERAGAELVGLAAQGLGADQITGQGQLHRLANRAAVAVQAHQALHHAPHGAGFTGQEHGLLGAANLLGGCNHGSSSAMGRNNRGENRRKMG